MRKMNGKMVYAALYCLYTANDPYFSMFKVKNKEGKFRKEVKSHSFL